MGLLSRFRRSRAGGADRAGELRTPEADDQRHLEQFIRTRHGVEGFVEPRTAVTDVTLLLVAHDGEWTRRRVPSVQWAHDFANRNRVPSYDAAVVGVPARMREWNSRHKQQRRSDGGAAGS